MARSRQYFADDGGVDAHRECCAATDSGLEHCAVGEGTISRQVRRSDSGAVTGGWVSLPFILVDFTSLMANTSV
jgi:hypothetical protein